MTRLSLDIDDPTVVDALLRLVDPDGHLDPSVFEIGLTHYGRRVVDREPGHLGARVTDRHGRTWQRISNHDEPIWMCEDPHFGSGQDDFYAIAADYGPLVEETPASVVLGTTF